MYIPKHFQVHEVVDLISYIQSNSFGILFTQTANGPVASHLPFLIEKNRDGSLTLITHMAKANFHWKAHDCDALVVFQGPHAYISPTWYGPEYPAVPTWNYTAVHASGTLKVEEDDANVISILEKMTDYFEASQPVPWRPDFSPSSFMLPMTKALVGVRIELTSLEGKWKLSQNHPAENVQNVAQALDQQQDHESARVAQLMRDHHPRLSS
jgi:transcriptional regulator